MAAEDDETQLPLQSSSDDEDGDGIGELPKDPFACSLCADVDALNVILSCYTCKSTVFCTECFEAAKDNIECEQCGLIPIHHVQWSQDLQEKRYKVVRKPCNKCETEHPLNMIVPHIHACFPTKKLPKDMEDVVREYDKHTKKIIPYRKRLFGFSMNRDNREECEKARQKLLESSRRALELERRKRIKAFLDDPDPLGEEPEARPHKQQKTRAVEVVNFIDFFDEDDDSPSF